MNNQKKRRKQKQQQEQQQANVLLLYRTEYEKYVPYDCKHCSKSICFSQKICFRLFSPDGCALSDGTSAFFTVYRSLLLLLLIFPAPTLPLYTCHRSRYVSFVQVCVRVNFCVCQSLVSEITCLSLFFFFSISIFLGNPFNLTVTKNTWQITRHLLSVVAYIGCRQHKAHTHTHTHRNQIDTSRIIVFATVIEKSASYRNPHTERMRLWHDWYKVKLW